MAYTINGTAVTQPAGMIAASVLGKHVLNTVAEYSFDSLISDIIMQHSVACVGDCHLSTSYGMNSTLSKREEYFTVNWASYNYIPESVANLENTIDSPDFDYQQRVNELNQAYADNSDPDTWKFCMCVGGNQDGAYD